MTNVEDLSNDELRRVIVERNLQAQKEREAAQVCRICGEHDEEYGGIKGYLIPIRIVMNEGEEGHSDLEAFLCEYDLGDVQDALVKAGLGLHVHGGICFLEDTNCPGAKNMNDCPTPEQQYPE